MIGFAHGCVLSVHMREEWIFFEVVLAYFDTVTYISYVKYNIRNELMQVFQKSSHSEELCLRTDRLGPLPIVNHFLRKAGIEEILEKYVPTYDKRCTLAHAKALGVLLRSIIVEREPIYRQQETVDTFSPAMYGLSEDEARKVGDDRIGRALDKLFDTDRAALLTEIVISAGKQFSIRLDKLHNDSTTVTFCGQYRRAHGRRVRGKRAPWITFGFNKDHRPDLKQLLFCMTTSEDGGIPIQFRCYDGQTGDSPTHIETWRILRSIAGKEDFLYVADSKLCVRDSMDYIDRRRGRFVTVLPRTRLEDAEFRKWIQTNEPQWEKVWDRPNARRKHGPRDRWYVFRAPIPSREAWPVIWVYSSLLALRQEHTRREQIAAAIQKLSDFREALHNNRSRIKKAEEVEIRIENILQKYRVKRYLKVKRCSRQKCKFRQFKRGRPGPDAAYRKIVTRRWDIEWSLDDDAIEYDRKSDGMYPLLTNDRTLSPAQALQAHKGQPTIEKRFEQMKTVHEIAPVFLKNEDRIEALFTLYFIGMLIQALIERQLRLAMKRNNIEKLPIYPEERKCSHPTTEQIFRLFSHFQQHRLFFKGSFIKLFNNEMTELQTVVLSLLGIPKSRFKNLRFN